MQHEIQDSTTGTLSHALKDPISACVHCGFCLPTCPTYVTMGEEMDSPRGRIFLMKEVLEGNASPEDIGGYIDNCLGCQACVTACPSGVEYGELITAYRAWETPERERSLTEKAQRFVLLKTLPYPDRFRAACASAKLAKPFKKLMPKSFRSMLELTPDSLPAKVELEPFYPAESERKGKVALLLGCAQQALAPSISQAAIKVLNRCGVDVVIPQGQGCCGSLAMHIGAEKDAKRSAERSMESFPDDVDAIITTAAGCGSGMKEYPLLFTEEDDSKQAEVAEFSSKVIDVCEYIHQIGFVPPKNNRNEPIKVAYHDACHLAHAQKVRSSPRYLLSSVPGVELVEPADWELCCGSAGTYNIEHSDTAHTLGARKADNLIATGASTIATGNIGCLTQIAHHLKLKGVDIPIRHTVELLAGE